MTMAGTSLSPLSMLAGGTIGQFKLVKMSGSTANTVVVTGAGEDAIGIALVDAVSGDRIAIQLLTEDGTVKVIADGSITENTVLYAGATGKVSASVSGNAVGIARTAGVADKAMEMIPYPLGNGMSFTSNIKYRDDFFDFVDADFWTLDANNGGAVVEQDANGGVILLQASDTTDGDNDESYLVSTNEIYKPAAGKLAVFRFRVKLTEGNTNDASIVVGLSSTGLDWENIIADGGLTLEDSATHIAFLKSKDAAIWQGVVRDTALDADANVGAFTDAAWHDLMITVSSAAADTDATVNFLVDGVSGGTKAFTLSSAAEMRVGFGVKNGGTAGPANGEQLLIDLFDMDVQR